MATNDLTTLADVKAWLSIATGDTSLDTLLTRLITACSMYMQSYMNRILVISPYTLTFNGNGKREVMLGNYPIQTVTSVLVNGVSVPAGTPAGPYVDQQAGYYYDDDTVYLLGWEWCRGVQNCQVAYTAGLSPSDPDLFALAQACIETVGLRFKERSRIGEMSKSVNGEVISFFRGDFTPDVILLMDRIKNVVPA